MVEEIIELLDNPKFKLWVWSPNKLRDRYWQKILVEDPGKKEAIQKARVILEVLTRKFEVDFPDPAHVSRMLKSILSSK